MGAQGARTSRWPVDTWSWRSPPSSACTSGGQHRHSDYGAFTGSFLAPPTTGIKCGTIWKVKWGEVISGVKCGGIFLSFAFQWILLSCKYDEFFYIIIIISSLLFWLIGPCCKSAHCPGPSVLLQRLACVCSHAQKINPCQHNHHVNVVLNVLMVRHRDSSRYI